jgi:hypothetical protein
MKIALRKTMRFHFPKIEIDIAGRRGCSLTYWDRREIYRVSIWLWTFRRVFVILMFRVGGAA